MKMLSVALVAALVLAPAAHAVDIEPYLRLDKFEDIKLSPTGEYLAASVPLEDQTALVIIRRSDNSLTGRFSLGRDSHVDDFTWVSPKRVLISVAEKMGSLDSPIPTGELFAIDADGKAFENLIGYRVQGRGAGTHIQPKKVEDVSATLVDDLVADDRSVIVSVTPFLRDAYSRAERLDVNTGRRTTLASAPIRNADFMTDNAGQVRFAFGIGTNNVSRLYYRTAEGWSEINNEVASGRVETPIGFAADNRIAYLQVSQPKGPDAIVAYDVETGARREVLRHERVDPSGIIFESGTRVPIGAYFNDVHREARFFEEGSPTARLYKALESAFAGQNVAVTSETADGRTALVHVYSDRNPGDYYLFDTVAKKADYLLSSRDWFDPEAMNPMEAVDIPARDGTPLRAFVTYPKGKARQGLPLVVMPHGGPYGVRDGWGFDTHAQLLASAGYAVLQVNYRGSSGYGYAFEQAGGRQWGGLMQDDLTDATRWATSKGGAAADRVCLFGGSYGGYAALMGVAKEPTLYRCASGYVGVYDLPLMFGKGDIQDTQSGTSYLKQWIGPQETLGAVSPVNLADRVQVPVFLAAGGEDRRAPIEHTKRMEKALTKAGKSVETLYYSTEGHGFYEIDHRREFYTRLLAFLANNIGGEKVTATTGAAATAK